MLELALQAILDTNKGSLLWDVVSHDLYRSVRNSKVRLAVIRDGSHWIHHRTWVGSVGSVVIRRPTLKFHPHRDDCD